jgi:hypothetical protein
LVHESLPLRCGSLQPFPLSQAAAKPKFARRLPAHSRCRLASALLNTPFRNPEGPEPVEWPVSDIRNHRMGNRRMRSLLVESLWRLKKGTRGRGFKKFPHVLGFFALWLTNGFALRQSVEQFREARLVRITHGGLAIWLDPFGMLNPQVVVNLLPELGVGMDLVRHGYCLGERFQVCRGTLPPNPRRNGRPVVAL